ncbi:MAG: Hsp70 family protein [Planctomycetota bacterium]
MGKVAVDFGTGNTVLARFNETIERAETIELPGITTTMEYMPNHKKPHQKFIVPVTPSMIHYSETETLIGNQVLSRGLAEHGDTFRWMKRGIAQGATRRKRTAQGHKSPADAGKDFLTLLLNYASDQISPRDDEFTFTAPTEAFEDFEDWIRRVCEAVGIRRLRLIDEPTACILGYHGAARKEDRFLVFDFGCGTLDVAAVRVDMASEKKKAIQLGRAGEDIGGMDLDCWLADDFCRRHELNGPRRRQWEALILRQAETAKITLSDPAEQEADISVIDDVGPRKRVMRTTYRWTCDRCRQGEAGDHQQPGESCLGCLLLKENFLGQVRHTMDKALENAAVKAGVRRDDLVKVLVTGGTSLVPCVRRLLVQTFDHRAVLTNPFDAVSRGACRGIVAPILQHDYAIESYNAQRKDYEFKPMFRGGTEYPTGPDAVRLWARGSYDGMTRIGLKIFEVSRMKTRRLDVEMVDADGAIQDDSRVATQFAHICLNRDNPTFIVADPPVHLERDKKRFLCSFQVDGHRRLLVTVLDNFSGKTLLKDHPVVRL